VGTPVGCHLPDREPCVMRWLAQLRLRARSLFLVARVEQELDEELRYHLEREIEEGRAAGLAPDEARLAALRGLGAVSQNMEECRDMRGVSFVEHRIQDLRFALRQLRKHPAFACTAVVMLALGLSANVAIFGFVDAALVRSLPYEDPARLVTAFATRPEKAQVQVRGNVSYQDFLDWREQSRSFSSIGAYDVRPGFTLTTPEGPQRVPGLSVTAGFFRTLGVTPVLGREFQRDEEGPAAPPTVMLSYATWQTRFAARPDVLGHTLTLQGEPHVVIGVLPRDFHFTMAEHAAFWTAIRGRQYCWEHRRCRSLEAVARLAEDVSAETAAANLSSVMREVRSHYPDSHRDPETAKLVPLRDVMLGDIRPVLLALLSGAGLLLLIACINMVSLLLARSDSRSREIGLRSALGASATRLVWQFATEALVLVAIGSALGLVLAAFGMRSLGSLLTPDMISRMPYLQGIGLNLRLLAFSGGIALVAALVFTLAPVARLSMSERLAGLREGSRGTSGTTWRRFGAYLVMAELGIALVLLVSAGLLGKSFHRLLQVDIGINAQHLTLLGVQPMPGETSERPGVLARQVAERVAGLSSVQAVGYADLVPLSGGLAPTSVFRKDGSPDEHLDDYPVRRVSAGYFAALQAKLLRGRDFTEEEVASTRNVVIINDTAAQRYVPGADPIGKAIVIGAPPAREIVGVVADLKDGPLETPALPAAYVPFDQSSFGLVVRASGQERALFQSLARAIREVRPGLLIDGQTTMAERIDQQPSASLHRSSAWLAGGFAAVAFVLSVVGLYGVVAYSVGQRNREIAVRMALGAQRRSVYQLVLGEAAWLVGIGTALGIICSLAAANLMRRLLFGVQSWDATTLASAAAVLIVSALLASYIPARRAASVDPIEALRAE
jgi:macrolide transport system ATP-binding/permease protein